MKFFRGAAALLLALLLVTPVLAEPTGKSYVYRSNLGGRGGNVAPIPDPYTAEKIASAGLYLSAPSDMCLVDGYVYVVNSIDENAYGGLNATGRVVVLDVNLNYVRDIIVIDPETGEPHKMSEPRGVWVAGDQLYLCDRSGHEILICDLSTGVIKKRLGLPENEQVYASLLGANVDDPVARASITSKYLPCNIRTNAIGEIFVRAEGDYNGLLRLSPEGEFISYFGAAQIVLNFSMALDLIWRNINEFLGLNPPQKNFTTGEYSNFDIDKDGYIYVVRPTTEGNAELIRKLNHLSVNVLRKKENFGDAGYSVMRGDILRTNYNAITVDDEGFFTALDITHKRLFQYAEEGWELFIFGGEGVQAGTYVNPVALASHGTRLYVLDKGTCTVTMLEPTEFVKLVRQGEMLFADGFYDEALVYWERVIEICPNYQFAYYAAGRAHYLSGNYRTAMEYFKISDDPEDYSASFKHLRAEVIHNNFTWAFILLLVLLTLFFTWNALKRRGIIVVTKTPLDKAGKFKYMLYCLIHPIDGFAEMRYNHKQSLTVANGCMAFFLFACLFDVMFWSFNFGGTGGEGFSILVFLGYTLVYYFLFVLVNWLLGTFLVGKAKFKQLWINICYALVPTSVIYLINTCLSNMLTQDEWAIMELLYNVALVWTATLIFFAVRESQMYSFMRTLVSILLTYIGMIIVVFIAFLLISLVIQFVAFVRSVYDEALYRIRSQ